MLVRTVGPVDTVDTVSAVEASVMVIVLELAVLVPAVLALLQVEVLIPVEVDELLPPLGVSVGLLVPEELPAADDRCWSLLVSPDGVTDMLEPPSRVSLASESVFSPVRLISYSQLAPSRMGVLVPAERLCFPTPSSYSAIHSFISAKLKAG